MTSAGDAHRPPAPYCPWHEYDWTQCCQCCVERRAELRRIDNQLRSYWHTAGYSFRNTAWFKPCEVHAA